MKENIGEAVERLEKSINDVWFSTIYSQEDEERDLRVLLSDYKRVLKGNEDWKKAYQEEKDKQFELLRENQLAKEALKEQCDIADERNQLLKENKELKHKYDVFVKMSSDVIANSIPTQKVKDKIEELSEGPLTINENNKYYYETDAYNKIIIQVLQDLLEEKGE